MSFSTVAQQDKLKPRAAIYWARVEIGRHLGFRKSTTSRTWWARAYDPSTQKQERRSLGDFSNLPANERFSAAQKAAREWFKHLDEGGSSEVITVGHACERYAKELERTGGKNGAHLTAADKAKKAKEARRRFGQYIDNDPIARIPLTKLKAGDLKAWRHRLESTPAAFRRAGKGAGRGRGKGSETRARASTTVDRDMAVLRAALTLALEDGYISSAASWKKSLKATKAHNRRDLFLDRAQRRALLENIDDAHLRAFVGALAVLPLRPGALAALRVKDFDERFSSLKIATDKAGAGRTIVLPKTTAAMLEHASKDKLPGAPLFARWDGKAFRKDEWIRGIKAAAKKANLPDDVVAYSLRHAAITDLVVAGLDLLTVARLSGTSIEMIQSTYGKLRQDVARDALATLAL